MFLKFLSDQLNKIPHFFFEGGLGEKESLFVKPRRFTFINISAFYGLLGYCHQRPFLVGGIFTGAGMDYHLASAPGTPPHLLLRWPETLWMVRYHRVLSLAGDTMTTHSSKILIIWFPLPSTCRVITPSPAHLSYWGHEDWDVVFALKKLYLVWRQMHRPLGIAGCVSEVYLGVGSGAHREHVLNLLGQTCEV